MKKLVLVLAIAIIQQGFSQSYEVESITYAGETWVETCTITKQGKYRGSLIVIDYFDEDKKDDYMEILNFSSLFFNCGGYYVKRQDTDQKLYMYFCNNGHSNEIDNVRLCSNPKDMGSCMKFKIKE